MHLIIHCDGGSRGNPGFGYGSYVITEHCGHEYAKASRIPLGDNVTCNQAEYLILIEALKKASEKLPQSVDAFTDSRLVAEQVTKRWKCKHGEMSKLRLQVLSLTANWLFQIYWNPRKVSVEKFGH